MTRSLATSERIALLMEGIGSRAEGPGRVYLVGGATAAIIGWRDATVDADLKLDPEPAAVFEAIAALKEELDINVELAAPDQFVPALPGWRERSRFIVRHGQVDFLHYDFYGQALAKIERGHDADLTDVRALVERGLVDVDELARLFERIVPQLVRYPAIDEAGLRRKLAATLEELRGDVDAK